MKICRKNFNVYPSTLHNNILHRKAAVTVNTEKFGTSSLSCPAPRVVTAIPSLHNTFHPKTIRHLDLILTLDLDFIPDLDRYLDLDSLTTT